MSNEHGNVWSELSEMPGVKGLPFPWPVGAAVRLGLHASLRRFYRVVPSPETVAELRASTATSSSCDTPPASVVLVLYESDDAEAIARYANTARWFREARVQVPQIFGVTKRALIVEDGGDLLLCEQAETQELTQRYVEAAQVILAIHAHGSEAESPNPDWQLDAGRLRDELAFTEEYALRCWLNSDPSPGRDSAFERLAAATAKLPSRMCHRDYHSRNLLVREELMVVDFQDAMEGPLFYDLVSLLGDDYRDVPRTAMVAAIETFWVGARTSMPVSAVANVPDEPSLLPAGARQAFALTAAQRSLKALGTFGYQVSVAGRVEYAICADRAWKHAKRAVVSLGWDDLLTELVAFDNL